MSVSVMIEGTVKDMDAFEALLLKGLPATRSYEGCEGLTGSSEHGRTRQRRARRAMRIACAL